MMASPAPRNGFLEAGDTITRSYKSILDLIQKNSIPHRAKSDCVVWWRGGYISLRVSSLNSGLRKCAYFIKKIGTSVIERLAVMVGWLGYFSFLFCCFQVFSASTNRFAPTNGLVGAGLALANYY